MVSWFHGFIERQTDVGIKADELYDGPIDNQLKKIDKLTIRIFDRTDSGKRGPHFESDVSSDSPPMWVATV